jgi:hypothetical protein
VYRDGVWDRRSRIMRLQWDGRHPPIASAPRSHRLRAHEADHRAKNAFARRAVDRTSDQSRRRGPHRRAGAAHTLLAQCHWQGADLATLVEDELAARQYDRPS